MEQTLKSNRLLSLDIMRGITIAGMILVNDPGGKVPFVPLEHAEWIGLTPTDLVFPFFMFIMGITTFLSLRKTDFKWTRPTVFHILKRALLLWLIGLVIAYLFNFVFAWNSEACKTLPFGERFCASADTLGSLRILGVLPRLGICYGLAAFTAITLKHRYIPLFIALLFVVYFIILITGNGYAHDETNILYRFDDLVMGANHMFGEHPDPEGILSTLPAWGHVLIGFCVGKAVLSLDDLNAKIEKLFIYGSLLLFAGFLLSYGCPISKKLWTPTFSLTTCGFASLVLALLVWLIDKKGKTGRITDFFHVFGVNPLALYVLADLIAIPLSVIPVGMSEGKPGSLRLLLFDHIGEPLFGPQGGGLLYSILFVLICWCAGYWLYKKKIYIKL
jgi:predicted acyltransferase